jgi:hypothetical protein
MLAGYPFELWLTTTILLGLLIIVVALSIIAAFNHDIEIQNELNEKLALLLEKPEIAVAKNRFDQNIISGTYEGRRVNFEWWVPLGRQVHYNLLIRIENVMVEPTSIDSWAIDKIKRELPTNLPEAVLSKWRELCQLDYVYEIKSEINELTVLINRYYLTGVLPSFESAYSEFRDTKCVSDVLAAAIKIISG